MRSLIRRVSYANVASTTALVLAFAGGGTAMAAGLIGTGQIKNGAVTTPKIRNAAVTAPKIRNGAVVSPKIANGAVSGAKVAPDSLTGANIRENTLGTVPSASAADTTKNVLTAAVTGTGVLNTDGKNFGATSASHLGTGAYQVVFTRDVTGCAYFVTAGALTTGNPPTSITGAVRRAGNPNGVFITTRDANGTLVDAPFFTAVIC